MIVRDGHRFNCCESVLIVVDDERPLPGFNHNIMKVASNFGGGVGGWGSVCGAAAGTAIAFGLIFGTSGEEPLEEYKERRAAMRGVTQEFMKAFEGEFGSVNCMDLLGIDRRTEEGKKKYDELKAQGVFRCDEYVDWAAEKTLEMLVEL